MLLRRSKPPYIPGLNAWALRRYWVNMVDWKAELLGSAASPRPRASHPQPSAADLKSLIEAEARRQGVNPAYAVAIARQESGLDPTAVGDRGKSLGLFQLQPAAAKDAGIDPARRGELEDNIRGGVTYFKQKLQQSDGNVEQALSRYNRGTPTYKGLGDPRYVENVMRHVDGGAPREGLLQYARTPQRETRPAQTAAPIPPADGRSRVPERPSLTQRLASLVSPKGAEAESATRPPGAIDWNRELSLQPEQTSPEKPQTSPASPAQPPPQTDWHQELLGTTRPVPPTPPSPVGQAVRSAVRTASGGILGGVPELAVPALERLTDPSQVPQTAAGVGEVVGQRVGSMVAPGPGTAVGGVVGAVGGLTAGTLATEGRLPTWQEVGKEAVWSAVPEVAESVIRSAVRTVARGTRGGRLIRLDEAARRARALPEVFEAQSRQQVGQAFDAVRASGLQLDTGLIQQEVRALRPGKYADLLAEVRRLDQANRTGGRYQRLVENLRTPGATRIAGMPIGDLQDLRSYLRTRAEGMTSHEARQLVEDFQQSVDDAIDQGIARGRTPTGMTVADLQEARRQWARTRAAEDLGTLVERTIDVTPDLTMSSLNLKNMANSLRKNTGPLAQRINRSLDHTPGARAEFQREINDIAGLFETVELPMADVFGIWRAPGFAMARQGLSSILASPRGRQAFREAIVEGRGNLSLNAFAAAVNVARRELGFEPMDLLGQGEASNAEAVSAPPPSATPAAGR